MVKPISEKINQEIIKEYSVGNISQIKLSVKIGVSKSHIFRILKRSRSGNPQHKADLAVLENLKEPEAQSVRM